MNSFKDAVKNQKLGVLLCLYVVPGSSHVLFPAGYNQWRNCVEIKVCSEAKDNKANKEVIETIAKFFRLSEQDVSLVGGQKSREKTIRLNNISAKTICSQLEESLHEK
jgi:uncharacterized protein (TIGR00251 family)